MKSSLLPYYAFVLIYWLVGCLLLASISKYAFVSFISLIDINETEQGKNVINYIYSGYPFLEAAFVGFSFSIVFIITNALANRAKKLRKLSFAAIIVLKSILFIIGVAGALTIIYQSARYIDFYPIQDIEQLINEPVTKLLQLTMIVYFTGMAVLLNFLLILARKFGIQNLMNLIIGKYASPKEESKIFLFMDLKSSTQYGEQLNHYKYSKLLRDCFSELNGLIKKFHAEIYQYVGDEVVLTWDMDKKGNTSEPIDIFFSFQKGLAERKAYFIEKYGVLPEFKAGAHGGKVTVTEIGDLKRELAYHGDAINTASRIQGACNQYGAQFLISDDLLKKIEQLDYDQTALGSIRLKGKNKAIKIYSIQPAG